jgi:phenylpropionate dioxygenase-like ring-hydroxylating dioxygenase large terminal subunit
MTPQDLHGLVADGRVQARVYTDPAIFALEMERIFCRAWLYVAHDSQLREAGDFLLTRMGPREVIVVRDADGAVQVLRNACAHRGARLCAAPAGNARSFSCPYHGWRFRTDGSLAAVPHQRSYPPGFDLADPALQLRRAPRVATHRGFVFASWAADGPPLDEHLGPMREAIANLVERAPDGEIELAGGTLKQLYRGNWKTHHENANDTVHPTFVHQSSVHSAAAAPDAQDALDGNQARHMMRANNFGTAEWEGIGLHATTGGHSFMGGFYASGLLSPGGGDPVSLAYRAALEAARGKAAAAAILGMDRFNNLIWPNVSLNAQFHQLRVVHPVAVDRTEVHSACFRLKGAPEGVFERAVRFLTTLNSPASLIFSDDIEIFERCQRGLTGPGPEWVDMSRGLGLERPMQDGTVATPGASELPVRAQFAAWLAHMVRP